MNYNILEFDSSNIKILNDIETISGIIKVNGVDKFQETSNFITNHIKNLNADDITNGTTNKYIINNTHPADLTVSGDFTINGTDTTINSVLYSSNYVEIINNTPNTAFTITQYDPSNDVLSILNTTDELLKIKSNGNIGIGTAPSRKLDVAGDIKFTGKLYQGDSEFITSYWLKNGNDISISSNVIITGDLSVSGTTATINTDTYTTENLEIINNGTATSLVVRQLGETNNIFATSNISGEVFTIINNGNIGIGTNNPTNSKLHIYGTNTYDGTIKIVRGGSEYFVTNTGDDSEWTKGDNKLLIGVGEPSSGNTKIIIDNNGNFECHDINFTGTLKQNGSAFQSSYWEKAGNDDLYYTAANVGIGTNNPTQKLHVNGGNIVVTPSDEVGGSMGVGTDSPAQKLHVIGEIIATDKITSFYSDERLKTDIELIPEPLNIIEKLNGFYYKPNELAKSFGIKTNKKELGLSAQEVNKVLPELVDLAPFDTIRDENDNIVSKSGENYLTISYERLMPVIVESIKQLNNEIKILKEENRHLKEAIKKIY